MQKVIEGINQVKKIHDIRAKMDKLRAEEKGLVAEAKKHILQYGVLKVGGWVAELLVQHKRCPKWKDEFIKELGEAEAERVIGRTAPSVSEKLIVRNEA